MRVLYSAFVLVLVLICYATEAYALDGRANTWDLSSRIVVSGSSTFSPQQIVKALASDFDVLLAIHPAAPQQDLTELLRKKTLDGFLHQGFREATVKVAEDSRTAKITLRVVEGPRYLRDGVRLQGCRNISPQQLLERLTKPYPPQNAVASGFHKDRGQQVVEWKDRDGNRVTLSDPVWQKGKPARFSRQSLSGLHQSVKRALADLGYHFPQFRVEVDTGRIGNRAELVVQIDREGPSAVVGDIQLVGNQKNDRDVFLRHFSLFPGMSLTRAQQTRISHELWQSGRFIDHTVTPLEPFADDGPVKLRIKVTEYDKAPRLDEELSLAERTVLKGREQLASFKHGNLDLVVERKGMGAGFRHIASADGVLLHIWTTDKHSFPVNTLFVLSSNSLACYFIPQGLKVVAPVRNVRFSGWCRWTLSSPAKDPDRLMRLQFGAGIKNAKDERFGFSIDVTPVACIALAHEHSKKHAVKSSLSDSLLTISSDIMALKFNVESGKFVECTNRDPDNPKQIGSISFRQGAFRQTVEEFELLARDIPNAYDSQRPISSFVQALCRKEVLLPLAALDAEAEELRRLHDQLKLLPGLRELLVDVVLLPLDAAMVNAREESGKKPLTPPKFWIPIDGEKILKSKGVAGIYSILALPLADKFFPRETWPWTVWSEACLVVAGTTKYTNSVLQTIHSSDAYGPLCHLCTSWLLQRVDRQLAHSFAKRGLQKLSLEAFQCDYRPLISTQHAFGKCLLRIARRLRNFEDDDLQQLSRSLPPEMRASFRDFVGELCRTGDDPLADVLPSALDRWWQSGLKADVARALAQVRDRNDPSIETARTDVCEKVVSTPF